MHIGRYQLGVEVPLSVVTTNSSGDAAAPDACPTVVIYTSAAVRVSGYNGKKIPVVDAANTTGLFRYGAFLGPVFAAGRYTVVYQWVIGAFTGKEVSYFDVIAGGNSDGAVIAMAELQRPHARFVVQHLSSGKLSSNRNPTL